MGSGRPTGYANHKIIGWALARQLQVGFEIQYVFLRLVFKLINLCDSQMTFGRAKGPHACE